MNQPSKATSREWRPIRQLPNGGGKSGRRLRAAAVAAALLAVVGALAAWLLFFRLLPNAHFLPLCIGEYGEEFPVRGWVRQDGEALRSLGWKETNAFTSQQLALLRGELRQLAGRSLNGPLVVYLSAYARTAPNGELCLLPVDARLDRLDTWLPLREVFTYLSECKTRHKLLLLDIMQPFTEAQRGLLVNDSAERLQPLLEEVLANDPRLSVLCACAPGQVSIVAEELGQSVFAYVLRKGLRGQADGANDRRREDGRVSLSELVRYATAQVDQWTQRQRGVRQSPRLYGAADDYPLLAVDSSAAPPEEPPLPEAYPDWLSAGWKQRDRWRDEENAGRTPSLPALRAGLETALLRAEHLWRGGFPVERVQTELEAKCQRLERQRNERNLRPAPLRRDEMLVQLAGFAPYLEVDDAAERSWRNAVAAAAESRNDPNDLNSLRRPLDQKHFDRFIGRSLYGDAADGRVMTAWLETPWLRAAQRSQLWTARHQLLDALQEKRADTRSAVWDEKRGIAAEQQRGLRRAQRSLALLRLMGSDQVENVEKALAQLEQSPADARRMGAAAEALRRAWMRSSEPRP